MARKAAPAKRNSSTKPAARRSAKAKQPVRRTPNGKAVELVSNTPDVPLLALFEPAAITDGPAWRRNLEFLFSLPKWSVEAVAVKTGKDRSTVYKWRDEGPDGNSIPVDQMEQLASDFGFAMECWFWPLERFTDMIKEQYPGYFGGSISDIDATGGNNTVELERKTPEKPVPFRELAAAA